MTSPDTQTAARRQADIARDMQAAYAHDLAGRSDRAEALYRKVLQKDPNNPDALHLLGVLAHERGRYPRAIQLIERALERVPEFAAAHLNLGNALRMSGRLSDAADSYRRAIELRPDYAAAHCDFAATLNDQGDFATGLASADRAVELQPDLAEAHINRATALLGLRRLEQAEAAYRRAIELQPGRAASLCGLGQVLGGLGRADEALDCFRRAVELDPDVPGPHRVLASLGQTPQDEAQIQRLTSVLRNRTRPPTDRIISGFALGNLLDNAGRYEEAFARFSEVNALYRETQIRSEDRFDPKALHREVDGLIERCTPELFRHAASQGSPSELPVFIVGMPRSGTSLVEQVAASHSQVASIGERKEISELTVAVLSQMQDRAPTEPDEDLTLRLTNEHVALLQRLGGGVARVIDKMPDNIFHLGVIAPLFPQARIIFCRRDPRDICLSCYFELFAEGNAFAYDLIESGIRALEIERLTAHWLQVLPLRMLTVDYEEFVANPEAQSRRLIDFLDLDWEPGCLNFHTTRRPFFTGSTWQVRQPLYHRSVERWRHYEAHLDPLLKLLGQGAQ